MSFKQDKEKLLGDLSALKTLNELPIINKTNSLQSLNFKTINGKNKINNAFEFVSDLLTTFKGHDGQIKVLKELTTNKVKEFEDELKKSLSSLLKDVSNCSINPSLPPDLIHQNFNISSNGYKIKLKFCDITNIFKIDINSDFGKLFFYDIQNNLNSKDFNTFIYNVIQNPNIEFEWGNQVNVDPILSVTFIENDGIDINYLLIRASQFYSNPINNKTLIDFNHDFIYSLTLFDVNIIVNYLLDFTFGTISKSLKKTQSEIEVEELLNTIIDKIINSSENENFTEEFFNFTNDEIEQYAKRSLERSKGKLPINGSNGLIANLEFQTLIDNNNLLLSATSFNQQSIIIKDFYDSIGNLTNINGLDKSNGSNLSNSEIKISLNTEMVKNLIKSLVSVLVSPKIMILLILNYKIVDNNLNGFIDIVDLVKKNKTVFVNLIKKILKVVIKKYLSETLKEIVKLINQDNIKEVQEKFKNYKEVVKSLKDVNLNSLNILKDLLL